MPSMSERASRAHRARRLRASSTQRRIERASESPSRSSVGSDLSTSLSVDTDYTNKGSASIPPAPVTPTLPVQLVQSNSSRFMAPDMVDEEMPMDEMQDIKKVYPHNVITPTHASMTSSTVSMSTSVASSEDSRHVRRGMRNPIPQSPKRGKEHNLRAPSVESVRSARAPSVESARSARAPSVESQRSVQSIESARSAQSPASEAKAKPRISTVDAADRGGGHLIPIDSIASIGTNSSVGRLATAIRRNATRRPDKLNIEEKALWDVVQTSLTSQQTEMSTKRRLLERQLQESTSQVDKLRVHNLELQQDLDTTKSHLQNAKRQVQTAKAFQFKDNRDDRNNSKEMEAKLEALQRKYDVAATMTETQQEEHERSIRAIQRVMNDVNEQKEEQVTALQEQIEELQERMEKKEEKVQQARAIESADVANLRARAQRAFQLESEMEELKNILMQVEDERDQSQQDLDKKFGQITILEQELIVIKNSLVNARDKEVGFMEIITQQRKKLTEISQEQNKAPAPRQLTGSETREVDSVRKELAERSASLENAKKLILSLEVANGSMATDLRGKLKIKDEQVLSLQAEAADRKRTIDSFATELKILQNQQAEAGQSDSKMHDNHHLLAEKLELAINDLQSATVVLESSGPDNEGAMDEISVILCNALMALKVSLQAMEGDFKLDEMNGNARAINRGKDPPSIHVREELRKKEAKLRMMEASLRTAQGEIELTKLKNERLQLEKDQDEVKMEVEIRHLKDECKTNMEVLTRKEQELQVLRNSLELGDGVGYISGDESDDNEEDDQRAIALSPAGTASYSASKAEALATLLAHSGSGVDVNVSSVEIERMHNMIVTAEKEKKRAKDDLQTEKESLANAKMIISSLEKANKTMLEDLRSRLQDSNTAIAALLDKSMVNERSTSELRNELERVKKDKLKAEREHQDEIAKLKDEALVSALRLAAKDREISDRPTPDEESGEDKKEEE